MSEIMLPVFMFQIQYYSQINLTILTQVLNRNLQLSSKLIIMYVLPTKPLSLYFSFSFLLSLPFALLLTLFVIQPTSPNSFTVKGKKFFDRLNGQKTFHGVNLVNKQFPYYDPEFDESKIQQLKQMGINAVRLGVMWPGLEPKQGEYNETYLKKMVELVGKMGQNGIYTLVEFHQDLYSKVFCSDGVPDWAIQDELKRGFPGPLTFNPDKGKCSRQWSDYYFSYGVNQGFNQLYTNYHGLLDKFQNYWFKVAQSFQGNQYVIAYELINEPWPGNIYKQPFLLIPGLSQSTHLQRVYDRLAAKIREIDPNQNIAFQPVTWLNGLPSGFTHAPGGPQNSNLSILSIHYYNPPILALDQFLYARQLDTEKLQVGLLLTEFFGYTTQSDQERIIMDKCEQRGISWFTWQYTQRLKSQMIKRTYAQRVGGTKLKEKYWNQSREYQIQFQARKDSGETKIFFNFDHYLYGIENINDSEVTLLQHNLTQKKLETVKNQYNKFFANATSPFELIIRSASNYSILQQLLNIEIQLFPKVKFQIREFMYIIIDSKQIGDRNAILKIRRKNQYPEEIQIINKANMAKNNKKEQGSGTEAFQGFVNGAIDKIKGISHTVMNNHQQKQNKLHSLRSMSEEKVGQGFLSLETYSQNLNKISHLFIKRSDSQQQLQKNKPIISLERHKHFLKSSNS